MFKVRQVIGTQQQLKNRPNENKNDNSDDQETEDVILEIDDTERKKEEYMLNISSRSTKMNCHSYWTQERVEIVWQKF